jgi:hypothetical protein
MSPRLNQEELAELKAHHLACSHLIKGCQDATIKLRRERADQLMVDHPESTVEFRAIQILEDVLSSWCETLGVLRTNLNQSSPAHVRSWRSPTRTAFVFSRETTGKSSPRAERRGL